MTAAAATPSRFGLIIGAMKCGTTSLFNYLAEHPQVAACRAKEPNYFSSDDFRAEDRQRYFDLWDWKPETHRIAIEASVNYTKIPSKPNCAERIAQFSGCDFRFIYCMRNPIDRIESHVYHGLYAGWTRPLDEGISDHALNVSRYAMQLDPYVKCFGRERILLVVLEEFEEAPDAAFRRICEFLGIDANFALPSLDRHNRASDHYLESELWDRLRAIGLLRRIAHLVPDLWRQAALRWTGREVSARRRLTDAERIEVVSALRDDLARLASDYGIDPLATWGIDPS